MIKASAKMRDGRHLLICGFSAENVRRLTAGQTVFFETAAMHIPADETIGAITIFYGETENDCAKILEGLMGPATQVVVQPKGSSEPQ